MASHVKVIKEKWFPMMKSGNFKEVLSLVKATHLNGKESLIGIISISQLLYNDLKKGETLKGCVKDVVSLIQLLSQEPTSDKIKFINSLYHVVHFMYEKRHFDHLIKVFKIIMEFKKNNPDVFKNEAKEVYVPCYILLISSIKKALLAGQTSSAHPTVTDLLALLLEILLDNNCLTNGTLYLNSVTDVIVILSKHDLKAAVKLATSSMLPFYKVAKLEDAESCIPLLLKMYMCIFVYQQKLTSYVSALCAIECHLTEARKMFGENELHSECFQLLCNVTSLSNSNLSETAILEKIQSNNKILIKLQKLPNNNTVVNTCTLMSTLLINSFKSRKEDTPLFSNTCFQQFLQMILNLHYVFKAIYKDKTPENSNIINNLADVFHLVSDGGKQTDTEILKKCVKTIIEAQECIFSLVQFNKQVTSSPNEKETWTTSSIRIILPRCANLIRTYHVAGLSEEVIAIAKPVCKLICSLPNHILEDSACQQSAQLCFTCLVSALGTERLDKVLECVTAWLLAVPHNQKKAFKMWADFKHNTVCEGKQDHLDTTIWTIVSEKKSIMEEEWLPCNLAPTELGRLLVEELRMYFVNRSLRGQPVIAAADALLSLSSSVDCLTMVKGLVVAMDITTVSDAFPEKCLHYYNTSKQLAIRLRKEKKNFDPVDFNCCMADLTYAQLRFQLKKLRTECESEIIRLSVGPAEPLIEELPESRPDPNDTCDISSKYSNLCLSKQRSLLENMDSALRHWEFAYEMLKEVNDVAGYDLRVTLENVADAGQLMKLYIDKVKQVTIWKLLYNMATLIGESRMVVTAVGEMLNIDENIKPNWIENAKNLIDSTDLSDKATRGFQINRALSCLERNQISEGLEILANLESNAKKNNLQYTQFLTVIGEYQMMRDWQKYKHTFSSTPTYHLSFHKAISFLLFLARESKWSSFGEACQIQCQLLKAARLFGEANWEMEHPREARSYLKPILSIAQKLALPLRSVELLVVLAWVDLTTGLVDDCAVKLEGLEDLLELNVSPLTYNQVNGTPPPSKKLSKVSTPKFLSHPSSCRCLACTTSEYQRLVLETLTLRATFCVALRKKQEARQCFQVAMKVEEVLHSSPNEGVRLTCARMWLRYATSFDFDTAVEDALTANSKAYDLLKSTRDPNTIQHAIERRVLLNSMSLQLKHQPIKPLLSFEAEKTEAPEVHTPVKKPAVPKSRKTLLTSKNENVIPVTPFARPVKPLKFPASDDEENTPPVTASKTKKKTKPIPKFVLDTPQSVLRPTTVRTPFVIVDDEGKPVGVSSSKNLNRKKPTNNAASVAEPVLPKKKLFTDMSDLASSLENEEEIVRKSKRKGGNTNTKLHETSTAFTPFLENEGEEIIRKSGRGTVKTYKSKLPVKKEKSQDTKKNQEKQIANKNQASSIEGAFAFYQMKNAIATISKESNSTKKSDSTKLSPNLVLPKKGSFCSRLISQSSPGGLVMSAGDDCDSDIIEGTPPPPETTKQNYSRIRLTRATRSSQK